MSCVAVFCTKPHENICTHESESGIVKTMRYWVDASISCDKCECMSAVARVAEIGAGTRICRRIAEVGLVV